MGDDEQSAESAETGSSQRSPTPVPTQPRPTNRVTDVLYIVWWLVNRNGAAKKPVEMSDVSLAYDMGRNRGGIYRALDLLKKEGWVERGGPQHPNANVRSEVRVRLNHKVGGFRIGDWLDILHDDFEMRAEREQPGIEAHQKMVDAKREEERERREAERAEQKAKQAERKAKQVKR